MLTKSLVMDPLELSLRPLLQKQERQLLLKKSSKTRDTKIVSWQFWKCYTTQIVLRWGKVFILTAINPTKCIWTSSWTISLKQPTEWWRITLKWSRWYPTSLSNFTLTSSWGLLPIFTPWVFVTETSSLRIFSVIWIAMYLSCVISVVPNSSYKVSPMCPTFVLDITEPQNLFLGILIIRPQ